MYDPFFSHIKEAWNLRDHQNVLFIYFEEMKRDLRKVIERVAKFLDKELSENDIQILLNHLDFKNFKNNSAVNNEVWKSFGLAKQEGSFIRKGEVGGWKKEMEDHPEIVEKLSNWVDESLKATGIVFPKC